MDPPIGRGDPNTSATGGDIIRTPGSGGYFSGSAGTTHGESGRTIGDEGRRYTVLAKGGEKVKVSRTKTVGQTGDCDKDEIYRWSYPEGTYMDNGGNNY